MQQQPWQRTVMNGETLEGFVLELHGRPANVCLYNSCVTTAKFTHPGSNPCSKHRTATAGGNSCLKEMPVLESETPSTHRQKAPRAGDAEKALKHGTSTSEGEH